jgi:hypothetical protein
MNAAAQQNVDFSNDITAVTIGKIALELQKLAKAARESNREQILLSGRTINALIIAYQADLKRIIDSCTDPVRKDVLIRNGRVMRNYGVQLKILCSVKASTGTSFKI